ncbi:MAG: hypothetical protein FJ293_01310 [Planctomycetes bacterium]|nr:hypothetical protein [Planctomycetota bacterium]
MGHAGGVDGREHDRARRAVFGWLGGAILHETNNVLTVMAGVRQLARAGVPMSDRIGTMIDQQLAKMETLVGWIRRLAPEDAAGDAAARTAGAVAETVERVTELAWRGRGVRFERQVDPGAPPPADPEAAALVLLCLLLPVDPVRSGGNGAVRLVVEKQGDGLAFELRVAPAPVIRADDPDHARARALIAAAGGVLVAAEAAAESRWRVEFGAVRPHL